MGALSAQCDGARRRDGKGFSRADAQEGGRLAALKKRNWAWSVEDAKKAIEISSRYAKQAGEILGEGRKGKAAGIEASLRAGYVKCADVTVDEQPSYNYACFSPGGKRVHLWRTAPLPDLAGFKKSLQDMTKIRHGERRVQIDFDVAAEMTVNGIKKRGRRSEIDFNGSTKGSILSLAERNGFLIEPAIETPIDQEIDDLRRHERAAWMHEGIREGKRGVWIVFDLAHKHEPFSLAMKTHARDPKTGYRFYSCDPRDDWNWYVEWNERTRHLVRSLVNHFKFSASESIFK